MGMDVTRSIREPVQRMLWGKAAGRCQFAGCNRPLWKSAVTQEAVNIAQKAHIYAISEQGPRGNADILPDEINDPSNLMLLCHACHQKIDKHKDGGRYTADVLRAMKADHERRIELVTSIDPARQSHILLYGANIGAHSSPLSFQSTAACLFPERYPADDKPIELGMANSSFQDRDKEYWRVEEGQLIRMFNRRVRDRLADGSIEHLSVFALAPQPLLIRLGVLITDIPQAEVYQLHREPQGWGWLDDGHVPDFIVEEPGAIAGVPVLVLSLSATVQPERIHQLLGEDVALWTVTVRTPNNDVLKSRQQLRRFRELMRPLMDRVKALHGEHARLHVFPAAPVAVAVELGRIRMPKADLPWRIYDQVNACGGFVPAIDIPKEPNHER